MDVVFLDANVLFSAAYRPDAGSRELWELPDVELVTSDYALAEARRNIGDRQQLNDLDNLLQRVRVIGLTRLERPLPPGLKLPDKDRPIFLSAIDARATHLLSGDGKTFGAYFGQRVEGIAILLPGDYLINIMGSDLNLRMRC